MQNKPITNSSRGAYKKWLRYYLDFCRNHKFPLYVKRVCPALSGIAGKKQTKVQQAQAVKAITLYYEILKAKGVSNKKLCSKLQVLRHTPLSKTKNTFLFKRLLPGRFNIKRSCRSLPAIPNHHQLFMAPHTLLAHLRRVMLNGERAFPGKRYHLYETYVQKAIKEAVGESGICKRALLSTGEITPP